MTSVCLEILFSLSIINPDPAWNLLGMWAFKNSLRIISVSAPFSPELGFEFRIYSNSERNLFAASVNSFDIVGFFILDSSWYNGKRSRQPSRRALAAW